MLTYNVSNWHFQKMTIHTNLIQQALLCVSFVSLIWQPLILDSWTHHKSKQMGIENPIKQNENPIIALNSQIFPPTTPTLTNIIHHNWLHEMWVPSYIHVQWMHEKCNLGRPPLNHGVLRSVRSQAGAVLLTFGRLAATRATSVGVPWVGGACFWVGEHRGPLGVK